MYLGSFLSPPSVSSHVATSRQINQRIPTDDVLIHTYIIKTRADNVEGTECYTSGVCYLYLFTGLIGYNGTTPPILKPTDLLKFLYSNHA